MDRFRAFACELCGPRGSVGVISNSINIAMQKSENFQLSFWYLYCLCCTALEMKILLLTWGIELINFVTLCLKFAPHYLWLCSTCPSFDKQGENVSADMVLYKTSQLKHFNPDSVRKKLDLLIQKNLLTKYFSILWSLFSWLGLFHSFFLFPFCKLHFTF
jgi:hypothetical protein